jgi:hypothetical protein
MSGKTLVPASRFTGRHLRPVMGPGAWISMGLDAQVTALTAAKPLGLFRGAISGRRFAPKGILYERAAA